MTPLDRRAAILIGVLKFVATHGEKRVPPRNSPGSLQSAATAWPCPDTNNVNSKWIEGRKQDWP